VNGGRRGLQIVVRPADLILATSAVTVYSVLTWGASGSPVSAL
jgi:hypothetical protein